jgi:hypothetical protein
VGCFQGSKLRFKEIENGLVGGDRTRKGRVQPFFKHRGISPCTQRSKGEEKKQEEKVGGIKIIII